MSMYPDSESFDPLRRLLALKRYEQPPPGYFQNFPRQVIARIQAGERAQDSSALQRWFWEAPWLQRLWAALESKPALAGAIGVAACAMLLAGFVFSKTPDTVPEQFLSSSSEAMLSLPTERAPRSSILEPAALLGFLGTNDFGGPSPGSLAGQQVNFTIQGN